MLYFRLVDTDNQPIKPDHLASHRVLLVSDDVVAQRMAGPGVRNWELARALARAGHRVTVAAPQPSPQPSPIGGEGDTAPPTDSSLGDRLTIVGYQREAANDHLRELAARADVIFTHGFVLHFLPFLKEAGKPLVVDIYNPFTIESLPRHVDEREFLEYQRVLNEQLRAGDFFICAGEKQRDYWLGLLTAANRVNPTTYNTDATMQRLVDIVPFGISSTSPVASFAVKGRLPGIPEDAKLLLWAGGIWEWFDPLTLVRAMPLVLQQEPRARLLFMGTRHPNPVVPPSAMAQQARELSAALGLLDNTVFFQDWVDYAQRASYLVAADVGVSIHAEHIETRFSFRTRLLDYIWAGVPMVISGGDSLSEMVATRGLGRVLAADADEHELAAALLDVLATPRTEYAARFAAVQPDFTWDKVAAPLLRFVADPQLAPDRDQYPTDAERATADAATHLAEVIAAKDEFALKIIREKDAYAEQIIHEKDAHAAQIIAEKDAYAERSIHDKDEVIAGLESGLEQSRNYTEQIIREKDAYAEQVVRDKDAYLEQVVRDKDTFTAQAVQDTSDRYEAIIAELRSQLAAQEAAIASLREEAAWRAGVMAQQQAELDRLNSSPIVRLGSRLKGKPHDPKVVTDKRTLAAHAASVELGTPPPNLAAPYVSIVIVNYNGLRFLHDCLASLAPDVLDYPADAYEVVLVDNASSDASIEYTRAQFPWVRIVANPANLAFAEGNNVAMRVAKGEFVLLLNNDTRVDPGWLRALADAAARHPRAAALTSKLLFFYRRLPLELEVTTFNPRQLGMSSDERDLGVIVTHITPDTARGAATTLSGVEYGPGFYGQEGEGESAYRWSAGHATAFVPFANDGQPLPLLLGINSARPEVAGPLRLRVCAGGETLLDVTDPPSGDIQIEIPPHLLVAIPPTIQNAGTLLLSDGSGRDRGAVVVGTSQSYELDAGQYDTEEQVFGFCGAGVLLRTAALREVGYFDSSFFMYYEDMDLAWRTRLAGWEVWYVPSAVVHHIHAGSSKEWSPFFIYHATRNRLYMLLKLAPPRLAWREWRRFAAHTLGMQTRRLGRATAPQTREMTGIQRRALLATIRHLPTLLAERRKIKRGAKVADKEIAKWMIKS